MQTYLADIFYNMMPIRCIQDMEIDKVHIFLFLDPHKSQEDKSYSKIHHKSNQNDKSNNNTSLSMFHKVHSIDYIFQNCPYSIDWGIK